MSNCVIVPNFAEIIETAADIGNFLFFLNGGRNRLELSKF